MKALLPFPPVLLLVILSAGGALPGLIMTGCGASEQREEPGTDGAPLVEIHTCRALPHRPVIRGYGSIEPVRKAEILPPLTETLVEMRFNEGDHVAEGDLLARLDTRALELQLSEQRSEREGCLAALRLADEKYSKALRDREARFYSIRSAEAEYRKARAELLRMEEVLERKKSLYQADGITGEELRSAELALMEKEIILDQAQCSLASLRIGFRPEDLAAAGLIHSENGKDSPRNETVSPSERNDREERKSLYLELNTRMELAERDLARAELMKAERRIASLELRIRECRIRSPLEGTIGRRYRDEGEKVSPDKALYTLYPEDPVHALVSLSEGDLLRIDRGMEALVISDATGEERRGRLDRLSPWINRESRSAELRILLDNKDGLFRIGQFVRVEISLEEESPRILIPPSALADHGKGNGEREDGSAGRNRAFVFLLRGNRIFGRELIPGLPEEEGIPVIQGLEEGDRIILSPGQGFRDGMEVRTR